EGVGTVLGDERIDEHDVRAQVGEPAAKRAADEAEAAGAQHSLIGEGGGARLVPGARPSLPTAVGALGRTCSRCTTSRHHQRSRASNVVVTRATLKNCERPYCRYQ